MPTTTDFHAMIELVMALAGHLHDMGAINSAVVTDLLRSRQEILGRDPANAALCRALQMQIDWFERLQSGESARPLPFQ